MRNDSILKKVIRKLMSKFDFFLCDKSLEGIVANLGNKYGYKNTRHIQKPVDSDQAPIPWFTYPAIEYLSQLNLSDKSVFEWGSGNSSLFFAKQSKQITSVESDEKWHEYVSQCSLPNQKLIFRNEANFVNSIDELSSTFDVIIIDSLKRYECALKAVSYLNRGGLIILDNSDWHPKTSAFLRDDSNLIEVDMHGFGPINDYSWTTSLYFHREFRFLPKDNIQPVFSKAAIHQVSEDDGIP